MHDQPDTTANTAANTAANTESRSNTLRAAFAVNRDSLAIQYYAIGGPDKTPVRIQLQDPNPPRRIEGIADAAQLANSLGRHLSETPEMPVLGRPMNPAVLALIK